MTLNDFQSSRWGKLIAIAIGFGTIVAFAASAERMRRAFFPPAAEVAVTVYSAEGAVVPGASLVRLNVELRKVGPEELSCVGEVKSEAPVTTGPMTMQASEAFRKFELLVRAGSADARKIAAGEFRVKCSNPQRDLPPTDWKRIRLTSRS